MISGPLSVKHQVHLDASDNLHHASAVISELNALFSHHPVDHNVAGEEKHKSIKSIFATSWLKKSNKVTTTTTHTHAHHETKPSTYHTPFSFSTTGTTTPQSPHTHGKNVSKATIERSVAAKIYLEQHFDRLYRVGLAGRTRRRREFELSLLKDTSLTESEKARKRREWVAEESRHMRAIRDRMSLDDFEMIKTIGHGGFGIVKLVREKATGEVLAMKILRKSEMLRRKQESHVRAERDLLSEAAEVSNWIVRLVYAFQDEEFLFFVLEFTPGGDLLTLLIRMDVFPESFAKYYAAQMVLAIEEAHKLGMIHRDIKPDNFLFDAEGHIRLSDFGLATDFHWAHDQHYYDQQRKLTSDMAGKPSDSNLGVAEEPEEDADLTSIPPHGHILEWRDANRKRMAFSVVGTNNYMAPEVLLGTGYDKSCDWWSLGVIVFEMIFGYPPFCSKNRQMTRLKIVNWRETLNFPDHPEVSYEAKDFISHLLCDRDDRLGRHPIGELKQKQSTALDSVDTLTSAQSTTPSTENLGPSNDDESAISRLLRKGDAEDIKSHPWFADIDWDSISNRSSSAPFKPVLSDDCDSRYFDPVDEEQVALVWGLGRDLKKDGKGEERSSDEEEEEEMLEMRKKLAFTGFTYKIKRKEGHAALANVFGEQ
ncbi:hypothetical protein HDU76_012845 [Blyttiomyces sp. JEL0837]|nr:hypothetical protein HDU76_012845 [Blyttiomyces sp. JEL0837]